MAENGHGRFGFRNHPEGKKPEKGLDSILKVPVIRQDLQDFLDIFLFPEEREKEKSMVTTYMSIFQKQRDRGCCFQDFFRKS